MGVAKVINFYSKKKVRFVLIPNFVYNGAFVTNNYYVGYEFITFATN